MQNAKTYPIVRCIENQDGRLQYGLTPVPKQFLLVGEVC